MANSKPSDKVITVDQINFMLKHLVELKFKDSNPIIQTLMSLKDIETNTNTKDTINKESNKQ
jgi:hypothetical protein|tara:strand:- start:598 stop:783 length:186 start_codon:yes stop_codon:yes gene_type:complete